MRTGTAGAPVIRRMVVRVLRGAHDESQQKGTSATDKKRLAHEAESTVSGALVGAVIGAAAGPPGVVAGAMVGGLARGVAFDAGRHAGRTRELDAEIGVSEGELGAPNLAHPPPKVGAYSAALTGAATGPGSAPAEGPIDPPEE